MSDSDLAGFYERVARYERERAKGRGFEAVGTLGRSYYLRQESRGRFRYIVLIAMAGVILLAMKAAIIVNLGEATYADRLARLLDGEGIDRIGAAIMQPDPLSGAMVDWARSKGF